MKTFPVIVRLVIVRLVIIWLVVGLFGQQQAVIADGLSNSRPNIVLVITDDQGYGPVGRHGHPWIRTPHLDDLYDHSTHFTRFLVAPTCAPTRSALMTGRHPMRNGVTHTVFERERMTLDATTLPQVLKQSGYTTGIFGKWHLGDEHDYQPDQRGFDEAFIHGAGGIGQAYDCSCADAPGNKYFDPVVRHNGSFMKTRGFCTDVFFTGALGWINSVRSKDSPFFAYITTNAPHGPFLAPDKYKKRFLDMKFNEADAGFFGMIENIDDNVGRLIQYLDTWQLLDNTVVIFMSDNGMTPRRRDQPGDELGQTPNGTPLREFNAGMKGFKGSPDEGGVRVPFFVRWDGHVNGGQDIDTVAAHIDLFPTLVDIAGGTPPEGQVEGRSLVPLIENPDVAWEDRFLITHCGRWPIGAEPNDHQWKQFAVRNQRFRMVGGALFDMQEDPGQTRDVSADHRDVMNRMNGVFAQWWTETRPMMVNEEVPQSATRPFHVWYEEQLKNGGIPDWDEPQL